MILSSHDLHYVDISRACFVMPRAFAFACPFLEKPHRRFQGMARWPIYSTAQPLYRTRFDTALKMSLNRLTTPSLMPSSRPFEHMHPLRTSGWRSMTDEESLGQ